MRTFTDNAGRTWTIAINVAAIKRVRGLLNVDLYKLVDDGFKPLGALVGDPVMLADVLYCLCKDEADAKQITDEDFGRALGGDAITLRARRTRQQVLRQHLMVVPLFWIRPLP